MNEKNNNTHCCTLMGTFLHDPRVTIQYSPVFREYSLKTTSGANQLIPHCPFCGTSLPSSLRNTLFEILEKEYHIDDPFDDQQSKTIPKEFKSDTWWKQRNL